jgi:alpha-D-ribose 1-methylphosphonate 5-triphosphate diphosphatase
MLEPSISEAASVNGNCLSVQQVSALPRRARIDAALHQPFVLRNARVVLPDAVHDTAILVVNGVIERVAQTVSNPAVTVDCDGDYLLPGLIELHTDNFERHLAPRPGTFWAANRAILPHDAELACAGITTACDAVTLGNDVGRGAYQRMHIEQITASASARAEGLLRIDHQLHVRCELSNPRLPEHLEHGLPDRPLLLSLMDHTPGQGQWCDLERFREHYVGRYGLKADEVDALITHRQRKRSVCAASNRAAALRFARDHRCILASHDDATKADVELASRDSCSIAEFPTSLEAARAARKLGMYVVAGAPNLVRGGSHSGNVAAADLVENGLCDILSSDYCPSSLLQGAFLLADKFSMPLAEALERVSLAPARALGLFDRGCIQEDKRADLVRVRETSRGPVVVAVWCGGRQVA